MTLAPDVPKKDTVLSGRVNSIKDAYWHSNLPSRAYLKRKRIQYFLVVKI
nr:ribosomal protein S11 [Flemingia sp.]WPN87333.1 ribosomal protein S11 [Flemingia sp.]